jgi:hypothetical protein
MQIPEYVRRELSEVYLLMDHIAGRQNKKLDEALAPPTTGGTPITLEQICGVAWPPTDLDRAKTLALVLTAKDRLSHAAYPATAYSVAFTYLSITPHSGTRAKSIRHSVVAHVRRHLSRGPNSGGPNSRNSAMPADAAVAGERGATNGNEEVKAVAGDANASTMVQFAKDAFPGLDAKREWLVTKMKWLAVVLAILLVMTCAVSWDLAIGQRLLGDYRWLSQHPEVMQIDQTQKDPSCGQAQPAVGQGPLTNHAQAPTDAKEVADAGKIPADGLCARFLAGTRLLPMMERWVNQQILLPSFVRGAPGIPPSPDDRLSYQGYILELARVLVTTLNYDVLPLFLGALAAAAAALRSINRKTAGNELEPRDLVQVWPRVLLGAFLGAVIGLLISPGASNGLFTAIQTSTNSGVAAAGADTTNTVALSPAAYAFLAGFATGRMFDWLDNMLERMFAFASPKT